MTMATDPSHRVIIITVPELHHFILQSRPCLLTIVTIDIAAAENTNLQSMPICYEIEKLKMKFLFSIINSTHTW